MHDGGLCCMFAYGTDILVRFGVTNEGRLCRHPLNAAWVLLPDVLKNEIPVVRYIDRCALIPSSQQLVDCDGGMLPV